MIKFKDSIGDITSAQLKKLLAPVLDFEKHSASENYIDTLPPETKQAIKEKKAIEGMDQDAVIWRWAGPCARPARPRMTSSRRPGNSASLRAA